MWVTWSKTDCVSNASEIFVFVLTIMPLHCFWSFLKHFQCRQCFCESPKGKNILMPTLWPCILAIYSLLMVIAILDALDIFCGRINIHLGVNRNPECGSFWSTSVQEKKQDLRLEKEEEPLAVTVVDGNCRGSPFHRREPTRAKNLD